MSGLPRLGRCLRSRRSVGSSVFAAALLLGGHAAAQEPAAPTAPATPTAPAAPTAKATASDSEKINEFLEAEYENDTESRSRAVAHDRRALADRVEHVLGNFVDLGGYFRAGYGRDGRGGPQTGFGAPGAPAKYRLGNEAENYGELIVGKSVYLPNAFRLHDDLRPDGTPSGPIARAQVRLSMVSPYATIDSSSGTTFDLPEAWASIGNVIGGQPEAKFWAGRRYYRRHDIHINDFFFWNMSGGGGGIEDLELGPVKLALAWIGFGTTNALGNVPQPDPNNAAGFSKSNFDFRSYDMPMLGGKAEIGLTIATLRSGLDQSGQKAPASTGAALSFVHSAAGFISPDGTNKLSLQYGRGPAKTFTAGFETVALPQGTFIRTEQKGSWRVRATEHFVASLSEHFSMSPVLIFQATDQADGSGRQYWYSAGLRPIAHLNRYFSVAVEGGLDWVHDTGANTSAGLGKLTLAPQVSIGNRFDSQPVIRAFGTAAFWGDDFVGQVGGADYANEQRGFSGGMQMEVWW